MLHAYSSLHLRECASCDSWSTHRTVSALHRHWRHDRFLVSIKSSNLNPQLIDTLVGSTTALRSTYLATLLGWSLLPFKASRLCYSSSVCYSVTNRLASWPSKIAGSKPTLSSPKFAICPRTIHTSKPSTVKWSLSWGMNDYSLVAPALRI